MEIRRALTVLPLVVGLCLGACSSGTNISPGTTASPPDQAAQPTEVPSATAVDQPAPTATISRLPAPATRGPIPVVTATPQQAGRGTIAFYSEREGNAEIYVMRADGSEVQQLTNHPADEVCPAWSPDGQRIAFMSTRNDPDPDGCFPDCSHDIYLMDADGGNEVQLTDTTWNELHPSWSPDGRSISFASNRGGNNDIFVMNVDGGELYQLTDHPEDEMRPSWSPDGERIAFNSMRDGNWHVYVMPAVGGDARQLTLGESWNLFPDWSPDGKQIIFFTMVRGSRKQDVAVMSADGTDIRKLTDNPRTVDEDPAWSPDGAQIAFQSDRDRNYEIYVMEADGSGLTNVTKALSDEYWPDWRPAAGGADVVGQIGPEATVISSEARSDSEMSALVKPSATPRPATHSVCATGCDFDTIQAVVDSPALGTDVVVELRDPIHTEPGIIIDRNITIRGMGAESTIVQASETLSSSPERVIEVREGAEVRLERITIRHGNPSNDEIGGGGIINFGSLVLTECVISNNTANDGAGLYNRGILTLVGTTVRDNFADAVAPPGYECGSGGGIKSTQGTLTVIDSTISGNQAGVDDRGRGGGAFISCDCDAKFINSTISGNKTVRYGGGIAVMGTLELIHSTVARNTSREPGSGVYVRGQMDYVNSLIADNYGGDNCVIGGEGGFRGKGSVGANSGNLVAGGGCGATFSDNPRLNHLADNGGLTFTHALREGSPAIDAIPPDQCQQTHDQRGVQRPIEVTSSDTPCDIGAFELEMR
jgi:Tol biopolymer transport system component